MKMPEELDSKLLAPCGINCISCERFQNPCAGCLISDDGKSKASLKCKIKACFDIFDSVTNSFIVSIYTFPQSKPLDTFKSLYISGVIEFRK